MISASIAPAAGGPAPFAGTREGFASSSQQRRLWRMVRDSRADRYDAYAWVLLDGPLDVDRLRASASELLAHHEILRTLLDVGGDDDAVEPRQVIAARRAIEMPVVDWREMTCGEDGMPHAFACDGERCRLPLTWCADEPWIVPLYHLSATRHLLLMRLPAWLADLTTQRLLVEDLARAYGPPATDGVDVSTAPSYVDVTAWQAEQVHGSAARAGLTFWQQRETRIGSRRASSRRARPLMPLRRHAVLIDHAVVAALTNVTSAETPLRDALVLAWAITLRDAWTETVTIRVASGRRGQRLRRVAGPLTRYLPLAVALTDETTVREAGRRVSRGIREIERWQELYQPDIAQSDTTPCLEYHQPARVMAGALRVEEWRSSATVDACELKLVCAHAGETLSVTLEFDEREHDRSTVAALGERFARVLQALAERPDAVIGVIDLVDSIERRLLLEQATGATTNPSPLRLHDLWRAQVLRTPRGIAARDAHREMTFAELDCRSQAIDAALRQVGVTHEQRVALLTDREPDALAAIFGVLSCGAAYVPLEPSWPAARLEAILADTGAVAVIVSRAHASKLAGWKGPRLRMDEIGESPMTPPPGESVALDRATPDSLCYVLYTSGSAGAPKGVMVTHRGIVTYLLWAMRAYAADGGSGAPVHTPLSFDLTLTGLLVPLLAGQAVTFVSEDEGLEGLAALLGSERDFGLVKLTPSHLSALQPLCERLNLSRATRSMVVGGEALRAETLAFWRARVPGLRVFNEYGPTETVVGCTVHEIAVEETDALAPIGRPIANSRVYLLDADLRLTPVGHDGEIYIGGAGVARGYLNQPAMTAERFAPDPFANEPGARMYCSGDRARAAWDGTLTFIGRGDGQVKIRGHRVELDEIAAVLAEHPAVQDVVVTPHTGPRDALTLAAWIVPDATRAPAVVRLLEMARREPHLQATTELPSELTVYHVNRGETEYLHRAIFERACYAPSADTLPPGACVLDVGANIGLFSLWLAQRCPDARIFAFEPMPVTCEMLRRNAAIHHGNIEAITMGLSNAASAEDFRFYPHLSLMSGKYVDPVADAETVRAFERGQSKGGWDEALFSGMLAERLRCEQVRVAVTTVSAFLRERGLTHVDLLKIDVERAELDVLAGIDDADWPHIARLVIEVHDVEGRLDLVTSLLRERGYELHIEREDDVANTGLCLVHAIRPAVLAAHAPQDEDRDGAGRERRWASVAALERNLREFARARLAEYMVPARITLLDALPLTPNQKVDRDALMARVPDNADPREHTPPRTDEERLLAAIWTDLLQQSQFGIDDSFFALGGDSILSIQVVARAAQAGLKLTPRQMFQSPTIAALAAVATRIPPTPAAEPKAGAAVATGHIPLTEAQAWFLVRAQAPHHYNHAMLLAVDPPVDIRRLEQALVALVARHDAFRLRFRRELGSWSQHLVESAGNTPVTRIALTALPEATRDAAIEQTASVLQQSLDLTRGPLHRAVIFVGTADGWPRVLLIMHHLITDGVSWRIVGDELARACRSEGASADDPPPVAFAEAAARLHTLTTEAIMRAGSAPEALAEPGRRLPLDSPGGRNTRAAMRTSTVTLSPNETRALLEIVCPACDADVEAVLLGHVVHALGAWLGGGAVRLDLERHGRHQGGDGLDLSRTLGWFTTIVPLTIDEEASRDALEAVSAVARRLRELPPVAVPVVDRAELSWNYHGRFEHAFAAGSPFRPAAESVGECVSPHAVRDYLLELTAWIGNSGLHLECAYGAELHQEETIARLMHAIGDGLRSCVHRAGIARAPVTHEADAAADVEALWPLSPIQSGVLFHSLEHGGRPMYIAQSHARVQGRLDPAALMAAWDDAVNRHPALRAAMRWESGGAARQAIARHVRMPWTVHDWRDRPPESSDASIAEFFARDWHEPFALHRPPLLRGALLRHGAEDWTIVWTIHHLIIDGWSAGLLLHDVFDAYDARVNGRTWTPPPAASYRDYLAWLAGRPAQASLDYWRRTLEHAPVPTPLPVSSGLAGASETPGARRTRLSEPLTTALVAAARRRDLTLNTLLQASWAVTLAHRCQQRDVVFGVTVSGRPPELPRVGEMVGLFINTLPLRVQIRPEESLSAWLTRVQMSQADLMDHGHCALVDIHRAAGFGRDIALYDSIVVFENFPVEKSLGEGRGALRVRDVGGRIRNHYPLTLRIVPGRELAIELVYDQRVFAASTIAHLLDGLVAVLTSFSTESRVQDLLDLLAGLDASRRATEDGHARAAGRAQLGHVRRKPVISPNRADS